MTHPVLWLGGSCAAGKTTIARTLALRFDLGFYRIDAHGYEHRDRLIARGLQEDSAKSYDERWLAPTAAQIARQFMDTSALHPALIMEDLAAMPDQVLTIVEGPQLFRDDIAPHWSGPRSALWLLSSEEFRRNALTARAGDAAKFTSDAKAAMDKRIERDNILSERVRTDAAESDLTVFAVDGTRDLPTMIECVADYFGKAIADGQSIVDGPMRQRVRRFENDSMVGNVRSFLKELGAKAPAEAGTLPFTCECERLGCEQIADRTRAQYDAIRPGHVLAHDSAR